MSLSFMANISILSFIFWYCHMLRVSYAKALRVYDTGVWETITATITSKLYITPHGEEYGEDYYTKTFSRKDWMPTMINLTYQYTYDNKLVTNTYRGEGRPFNADKRAGTLTVLHNPISGECIPSTIIQSIQAKCHKLRVYSILAICALVIGIGVAALGIVVRG